MTPHKIMQVAGKSRARTAVKAGVSEPKLRCYEEDPGAMTREKRRVNRPRCKRLDARAYFATTAAIVGIGYGAGGTDIRVQLAALALLAIFAVVAVLGAQ